MNEERITYLMEVFVEILGEELREIIREYQSGKLWNITFASNAEKWPESPIRQKNIEYVQDA